MIARLVRLALLTAALGGLAWAVHAQAPDLREVSGRAPVSRVRGYELGVGADPTFPVRGGDHLLRLVTNALVPAEVGGADVDYAIGVQILRPGAAPEDRVVHLRSHRTGALTGTPDPTFDRAGTPIADSRRVDLVLDPPAPPGTRIAVRAVGDIHALLRAWSSQPRDRADRAERLLALYPEMRHQLVAGLGVGAWDHLRPDERAALTGTRFARLAAEGSPGEGFSDHDFYVRSAVEVPDEELGPDTDLAEPTTWVVQGPAPIRVHVALARGAGPTTLTLRRFALDDVELATWTLDADHPTVDWEGVLPEGQHTLAVRADTAALGTVQLVAPAAASVDLAGPPGSPPDALVPLAPSTLRLFAISVGPGSPATFDAALPSDPEVRTVEVETWAVGDVDPTLTVRVIAGGRETSERVGTKLPVNPWDRQVDADGVTHPVRGPTRVKVLLPADVDRLVVESDVPALLRFRVPFLAVDEPEDGAEAPVTRRIGATTGPATRSWARASSPLGEAEIVVHGRIEPQPPPLPPPPTWIAATLQPRGLVNRFEALEPVVPPVTGRVLTEVEPGRVVHIRTAGAGRTAARWTYEVEDRELLGASFPLRLDGADAGTLRAAVSRGTFRMPALLPGDHTVEANPPPGVRVFVNVPAAPGESATTWKTRSLWPVGRASLEVPVVVGREGPRGVNVVVYDPSRGARPVEIVADLDGGHPRRRTSGSYTRTTPPTRTWTLPASDKPAPARLVDGARTVAGYARTLSFPLGDDLTPGTHMLRIRADLPTYARFFVVAPPGVVAGGDIADEEDPR